MSKKPKEQSSQPEPLTLEQRTARAQQNRDKWARVVQDPSLSPDLAQVAKDLSRSWGAAAALGQKAAAYQNQNTGPMLEKTPGVESLPQGQQPASAQATSFHRVGLSAVQFVMFFCGVTAVCATIAFLDNQPLIFGLLIVAVVLYWNFGRDEETRTSDFVHAIYGGGQPRGKDGRRWCIKQEGEGYIVFAFDGDPRAPAQYFRPEQNKTWSRGDAADRAAELAKKFSEGEK